MTGLSVLVLVLAVFAGIFNSIPVTIFFHVGFSVVENCDKNVKNVERCENTRK